MSIEGKQEAAIQCSTEPIYWNTVERKFVVQIKLGTEFNISFVTVPIDALVHPLCVIPDNSESNCDTFYVALPKKIGADTLEIIYRSNNITTTVNLIIGCKMIPLC